VSVNCTDWPAAGDAGLYVNEAATPVPGRTVILRLALLVLDPSEVTRVTILNPYDVKT